MTNKELLDDVQDTFSRVFNILEKKNADYANNEDALKNFKLVEKLGIATVEQGILVRMCDKISRLSTLLNKANTVEDEKMEDTIEDLIGYAVILKIALNNR